MRNRTTSVTIAVASLFAISVIFAPSAANASSIASVEQANTMPVWLAAVLATVALIVVAGGALIALTLRKRRHVALENERATVETY